MPLFSLINKETGEVRAIRRMSWEVAELANADEGIETGFKWHRGIDSSRKNPVRSLIPILNALDIEGFTDYHMNVINKWHRQRVKARALHFENWENAREAFGEFMRNQSEHDRKVVAKFMRNQNAQAFEAGLNLGMASRYTVDYEEDEFELD